MKNLLSGMPEPLKITLFYILGLTFLNVESEPDSIDSECGLGWAMYNYLIFS
jgi:hypothetical protein